MFVIFEKRDGWNYKELDKCGLTEYFERLEKLIYELKNCRRDSYAKIGSTTEDVLNEIIFIGTAISEISKELLIDIEMEDMQ